MSWDPSNLIHISTCVFHIFFLNKLGSVSLVGKSRNWKLHSWPREWNKHQFGSPKILLKILYFFFKFFFKKITCWWFEFSYVLDINGMPKKMEIIVINLRLLLLLFFLTPTISSNPFFHIYILWVLSKWTRIAFQSCRNQREHPKHWKL